ncbi:MAG: MalY/PatB family protein [Anaerolineae bacterium]
MAFDFDTHLDRRSFHSLKWSTYEPDVLPLPVADMDFATAPAIQEALGRLVNHGALGYPIEPPQLAEHVAAFVGRRHGWDISPDTLTFFPGVLAGVRAALTAFTQPGDAFVTLTPVYPPLFGIGRSMDRVPRLVPLHRDPRGRYTADLGRLEQALPGARALILCSPHNPVGRVFARDELEAIAELALRHDAVLISDEIHADLILGNRPHVPLGSLDHDISRCSVTLMAPSKTFNIAGLPLGFAITSDATLRSQLQSAARSAGCAITLPAWIAAEAAYSDPDAEAWLDALLAYLSANMALTAESIAHDLPEIILSPAEGTFLAWLDLSALGLPEPPAAYLLRHARVAVNEGRSFGPGGEGHVRLNVGCPRALLSEALQRIESALGNTNSDLQS